MICFISAFFFTTIANVSFVYGTMPLVTYFLSLIFLKEKISLFSISCCAVSTLGMAIMTFGNTALNDYLGISLALGMVFFMAALTVAAKFSQNLTPRRQLIYPRFWALLLCCHFPPFYSSRLRLYLAGTIWVRKCRVGVRCLPAWCQESFSTRRCIDRFN